MFKRILFVLPLVCVLADPARLAAQSTALLTGTVTDASNAAVPGAHVECRNSETGLTYTATTGAEGLFRFPDLPIGVYDLTATHAGFSPLVRRGITLVTGHSVDVRVQLQVGQTTQALQVSETVQVVQPTSSELQTSIESRSMSDLPLNGRNPLQLVNLTTGAINLGGANGGSGNFQSANSQIAVNGNRGTDNDYQLDGVNYTDVHFGTAPVLPSPDGLEEFTVKSSNFSASESGAGASVQFSTRSGTNQFHGSLFEFLRNNDMDARNFFSSTVTPFKRNQYGGTFGGPIIKDKTFFFFSYQGTRLTGGASPSVATPPSAALRQGDYSGSSRIIIDPLTGQPFPGNVIPSDRFDPLAQKLLQYIPLPNQPNGTFVAKPHTDQTDDQFSVKVDHNISAKDHLAGRFFFDNFDFQEATSPFPNIYATDAYSNRNVMLSETHTFSPDLLLVASFGYTGVPRTRGPVTPTTMQALGSTVPEATPNVPPQLLVAINNYANLNSGTPISIQPDTFEYRARATWAHGKHMVQFGMDVIRNHEYAIDQSRETGSWTFDGSRTAATGIKNSGDPFADFMVGLPFFFTQHAASPQDVYETKWQPWVQDDWKVTSRLTLNLGVRWEPWLPPEDDIAPQVGFEPGVQSVVAPNAPLGLVFSGDPGLRYSIFPADWNNIAPRVGFAWDVQGNGKTVVRAAYGIFYRPAPINLQRFSGNTAAFRGLTTNVSDPASFGNPYLNYSGGDPYPWTVPTAADLKTYKFNLPVVTSALNPNTSTSYVQEWNFTVERQIRPDLGLSVAYVGNHMIDGLSSTEGNPAIYGPGATEANSDSRRPYRGIGALQMVSPFEISKYDALQFTVTKHAARGLTVLANYVYSRCMDNNSGTIGGVSVINKLDPNKDYSRCDFDLTHMVNVSLVYALPRVGRLHGLMGGVVNNWTLTSILTIHSGSPFSVFSGRDNSLSGPTTNSGVNDLADMVTPQSWRPAGANSLREWFNTAAYVQNALGTFGDSGRNGLTGPGMWNWDFGLLKDVPITDRVRTELRFEAFNLLNHANFGNPVATLTNVNFGRILTAAAPRVIQLSLRLAF